MKRHPLNTRESDMPKHMVNMDALIPREDFEAGGENLQPSSMFEKLKVTDLVPSAMVYLLLRKPDFQRETSNWSPEKVANLVQSLLGGDLIPSIILWRSQNGNLFVIDGAHRLSALIAWVHDDYGDKDISRKFYDNYVTPEQLTAAEETRKLISKKVGSFADLNHALSHPHNSKAEHVHRAKILSVSALQLQWVSGGAEKAEESFFRINQEATPIEPTELAMIRSRKKPNAIAARALIRAGVGHKYWQSFTPEVRSEIQQLAREVYDTLFVPPIEDPIKTLDLPVAGRGYSAESVKLVFEFVNHANGLTTDKQLGDLKPDPDGLQTVEYLKKVRALAMKIAGTSPGSLGLHPAVYFYGASGLYQPSAFLATVRFAQQLFNEDKFFLFTSVRARVEDFLLKYRYFTNQIVHKLGSGKRSLEPIVFVYDTVFRGAVDKKSDEEIVAMLMSNRRVASCIRVITEEDIELRSEFSRETKAAVFLRTALESPIRCRICKAILHKRSMTVDHIIRKEDGGRGTVDNGQLAHPYCNSGYKERLTALARKPPKS